MRLLVFYPTTFFLLFCLLSAHCRPIFRDTLDHAQELADKVFHGVQSGIRNGVEAAENLVNKLGMNRDHGNRPANLEQNEPEKNGKKQPYHPKRQKVSNKFPLVLKMYGMDIKSILFNLILRARITKTERRCISWLVSSSS